MNMSFLKPDIKKIILFILLLAGIGALPLIPTHRVIMCITTPCNPIIGFSSIYSLGYGNHYVLFSAATYIVIILEIIAAYILSCIIINISQKKK